MPKTLIEYYRNHEAWDLIELKRQALESVRYSRGDLELRRAQTIAILESAARSRSNTVAVLYDDTLDDLRDHLNSLSADERSFDSWSGSYLSSLRASARALPGPPPRHVSDVYLSALDEAIAVRQGELQLLQEQAGSLSDLIAERTTELGKLAKEIDAQRSKLTADAATISQAVSTVDEQLRVQGEAMLAAWEREREVRNQSLDDQMSDQIRLLSTAALTGRRLVEQAAGNLTAADWAGRAKRERWNAHGLRWASVAAFASAVAVGAWVVWTAIEKELSLTVGDGILRGAVVLALAGVGSFLTIESRRHFREADSAEDVKLALAALEPYYASSDDEERATVRRALGDTVFIKNTLSRFSSRDASKHSALTNEQLNQVVDIISKGADVASKTGRPAGA